MGAIRVIRRKRRQPPINGAVSSELSATLENVVVTTGTELDVLVNAQGVSFDPIAAAADWRLYCRLVGASGYSLEAIATISGLSEVGNGSRVTIGIGGQLDDTVPFGLAIAAGSRAVSGSFGQPLTVSDDAGLGAPYTVIIAAR